MHIDQLSYVHFPIKLDLNFLLEYNVSSKFLITCILFQRSKQMNVAYLPQ